MAVRLLTDLWHVGCTWPDLVSRYFCGCHLFFLGHLLSVRQGHSLKELYVSVICAENVSVPSIWLPSRQRRGCACISYCTCNKDMYKLRDRCARYIRTSLSCNSEPLLDIFFLDQPLTTAWFEQHLGNLVVPLRL